MANTKQSDALKKWRQSGLGVLILIAFIAAWQILCDALKVPEFIIPSPYKIAVSFWTNTQSMLLPKHAWVTIYESMWGFVIGSVGGILLGLLMSRSKALEGIIFPYVIGSQIIPKTVLAPLFVIWFGFGVRSKIVIAVMMVFFPVLINVLLGLRSIDLNKRRLMQSLGGTPWQIFRLLELPSCMPYIFAGLKVSINLALVGAVVGEFVDPQEGLGYVVLVANGVLDVKLAFAAMFFLFILGVLMYGAVVVAEKYFLKWYEDTSIQAGLA